MDFYNSILSLPQDSVDNSKSDATLTFLDSVVKTLPTGLYSFPFPFFLNTIKDMKVSDLYLVPFSQQETLVRLCDRSKSLVTLLLSVLKNVEWSQITYYNMLKFIYGCYYISQLGQRCTSLDDILLSLQGFFPHYNMQTFVKIMSNFDVTKWCVTQFVMLGDDSTWTRCRFCPFAYPQDGFECDNCTETFKSIGKLYSHKFSAHNEPELSCKCWICAEIVSPENFETHLEQMHYCCPVKDHIPCPRCPLFCEPAYDIVTHVIQQHGFLCPQCDLGVDLVNLKEHLINHRYTKAKVEEILKDSKLFLLNRICPSESIFKRKQIVMKSNHDIEVSPQISCVPKEDYNFKKSPASTDFYADDDMELVSDVEDGMESVSDIEDDIEPVSDVDDEIENLLASHSNPVCEPKESVFKVLSDVERYESLLSMVDEELEDDIGAQTPLFLSEHLSNNEDIILSDALESGEDIDP